MAWSFINSVELSGQGGGAFNYPMPSGIQDGDLLVVNVFASAGGFGDLGFVADGWTAGPAETGAGATLTLSTSLKIASSEPASYPVSEGSGTTFMCAVLTAWRW